MIGTIDLYQAITEMRRFTRLGKPFSFTHIAYSYTKNKASGIRRVKKALLCPQSPDAKNQYSNHMLNYRDLSDNSLKRCWQPLIIEFEDKKVIIS